jgi:hypothetical protein
MLPEGESHAPAQRAQRKGMRGTMGFAVFLTWRSLRRGVKLFSSDLTWGGRKKGQSYNLHGESAKGAGGEE